MDNILERAARLTKTHMWGLLLLAVVLVASVWEVRAWKARHPGAMTVLESQAMDMSAMKAPIGSVPVATEIVHPGPFVATVTYSGSVAPFQEQNIYPRVQGWITDMKTYNGDLVERGELLAAIDSPDLQSQAAAASAGSVAAAADVPAAQSNTQRMAAERAAAVAEFHLAQAELTQKKAALGASEQTVIQRQEESKSAQADNEYWLAEIAREKKLLSAGAVSQQEYDAEMAQATSAAAEVENKRAMVAAAKADVDAAGAAVKSKESAVKAAVSRVKAAEAALEASRALATKSAALARQASQQARTASIMNEYRFIRAPFAGKVTLRYQSPGQFITPSTAILNIVQIDRVRLQANVADKDTALIKLGAPVIASFENYPAMTVNGRVTSVSPLVNQASRTGIVESLISNPDRKLVPGDMVTMRIGTRQMDDVITVPISAVVQKNGKAAVWIVREETPKGKKQYYCTMHPEVASDKPGKCPKCLMELVPKTGGGTKKAHLVMVTTGAGNGSRIEITTGLCDGDEVIYQGNTYLTEGDTVFPTKWSSEGPEKLPQAPAMAPMPGTDRGGHDMKNMPGM